MATLSSHKNTLYAGSKFAHTVARTVWRIKKKLDVIERLDFLNKLQEKYAYCSQWRPFYFSQFPMPHNIFVYQFLSENEEEVQMYEQFCLLVLS